MSRRGSGLYPNTDIGDVKESEGLDKLSSPTVEARAKSAYRDVDQEVDGNAGVVKLNVWVSLRWSGKLPIVNN